MNGRRVLIATSEPVHPIAHGGIQASAHDLSIGLARVLGAEVRLLTAQPPPRSQALDYRTGPCDSRIVPLARFEPELEATLDAWRPDLAIAQAAGWRLVVEHSRRRGVPVFHWLHGWLGLEGPGPLPRADLELANSDYTRRVVEARFGIRCEVFHPPVEPGRIRASRAAGPGGAVAMINPHPLKGVDRFLELAGRFPRRSFVAVDAWGTPPYVARRLARQPNVEHLPAGTDLAELYGRTSVLVVPTSWDETFGRVVVEAQANGIPVLASSRGALPEVVGEGGAALDYEAPLEDWTAALAGLLDPAAYATWSARARASAARYAFEDSILRFAAIAGW